MNVNEIRKKVEKEREMKFNLVFFFIALVLFIGLYFLGYNFYDAILGMKNVEKFMFFVGSVTGVLIYNSIVLFRYYGYDQPEEEVDDIESGVMGSYKYSSFQDRKRYIFMLSAILGGINAYLYLVWLGYLRG